MSHDMIMGLVTGIVFGVLLQRAGVIRYDKQLAALRLRDMTILKFMLSAIVVGSVGIQCLQGLGLIELSHKPMNVGAIVIGGILFGAGWAVMGYCPGTAVGAVGEGRWHALFALAGMLIGAAVYAELYPMCKATVLAWKDFGKIGLSDALGVSHWVIALPFAAGVVVLFRWFEKKGL